MALAENSFGLFLLDKYLFWKSLLTTDIFIIALSKKLGADCVELHTGRYCNLLNKKKKIKNEFSRIKKSAFYSEKVFLEVHAGHGLTYKTAYLVSKINSISEFNIGHFIIAESMFISLRKAIMKFKKIINK